MSPLDGAACGPFLGQMSRHPRPRALWISGILPLLLAAAAFGQPAGDWQGACKITFSGTSPLQNFTGTVSAEPFAVTLANPERGPGAGLAATVRVKAAKMDTDEPRRDEKMHETLEVTKHPEIVVRLPEGMTLAQTLPVVDGQSPRPTVVPFVLTLLGQDHEILGQVSEWRYAEGVARFRVSFPVSLKASGIKAPAVLGVVRVADEIQVQADLVLRDPR